MGKPTSHEAIILPNNDKLSYRVVELESGLVGVLVSDADTEKAAASLDVRVGSLLDPPEFQGLAHFLEHMLFYSSEKYPEEDAYSKFVSDHGGHTNAYTAAENTNYQFDVNHDHLEPALDRFAQFFICPLISADGVQREIKAVDSEHGKNVNTDAWRQHQLVKHTANPTHPFSRFFTGNALTLWEEPRAAGRDVRQAVADFYHRHYSANLMRVAIYGRESLDELEALLRDKFGAVPNLRLPVPQFHPDIFLKEHLGQLVRVVPVRTGHVLEMLWATPPTEDVYRAAPTSYLSHLLGHEGAGSVFALLKAKGWASALSSGESGSSMSCRGLFYVRIDLTDAGHAHVAEVAGTVFRYLDILRGEGGINQQIFEEMQALQALRFNWRDKVQPYSYVTSLASGLQQYPSRDLLLGLYHVPLEYDPALIRTFLDHLTPEAVRLTWASKEFDQQLTKHEPYYGTSYSQEPLPTEWLEAWTQGIGVGGDAGALHLPEANPFVPTDFGLKAPAEPLLLTACPALLLEEEGLRLYHRLETSFGTPKAVVYLDFQCPEAYASPETSVLTRLFTKLISDYLNELTYPAELAGLHYTLSNTLSGFQLTASGYNHKLPLLLSTLLNRIAEFKVDPARFAVVREALAKEYSNMRYQQPYQWAYYRSEVLLNFKRHRVEDYCVVVHQLTAQDLTAFMPRLLGRVFLEAMVAGNMLAPEAVKVVRGALESLLSGWGSTPPFPGQRKDLRMLKVPLGVGSVLEEPAPNAANNTNSATMVLYQVGTDDLRRNALAQLLVHVAKRDAFHQLRTVEQLGYIVYLSISQDLGVHSVIFVVQSTTKPCQHLAERIAAFVASTLQRLEDLPEEEFSHAVEELRKAKLEKPKRLGELAARWWSEVYQGTHRFDRQVAEADVLLTLSRADLRTFAGEVLGDAATCRKLEVRIRGGAELEAAASASATAGDAEAEAEAEAESCASGHGTGANGVTAAPLEVVAGGSRIRDVFEWKRGCEVWGAPCMRPRCAGAASAAAAAAAMVPTDAGGGSQQA